MAITFEEIRDQARSENWSNRKIKDTLFAAGLNERRAELLADLGRVTGSAPLPAPPQPVKQHLGPWYCCAFDDQHHRDFHTETLQEFAEKLADEIADADDPGIRFAAHILPKQREAWRADTERFDNSGTGYHTREQGAIRAFWDENTFSDDERERACPYARKDEIGPDEVIAALHLAFNGQDSPALGIAALA